MPTTWVPASNGVIPLGAVVAGRDCDGTLLFAGRAKHVGNVLPAKVKPGRGAYAPWEGQEHFKRDYEVLVGTTVEWKNGQSGSVHPETLAVGETMSGEVLFLGRAPYNASLTPGKVQQSKKCLLIPFEGKEIAIDEYEVMGS